MNATILANYINNTNHHDQKFLVILSKKSSKTTSNLHHHHHVFKIFIKNIKNKFLAMVQKYANKKTVRGKLGIPNGFPTQRQVRANTKASLAYRLNRYRIVCQYDYLASLGWFEFVSAK